MLEAIDLSIKKIKGEEVEETDIPKLHTREELFEIYQVFKKTILLLENIFV